MKQTQFVLIGVSIAVVLSDGCSKEASSETSLPSLSPSTPPKAQAVGLAIKDKESGRQPRQKSPQLVILQDQPNPTADRLRQELGDIEKNAPELAGKIAKLWKESVTLLPPRILPSAANASVANGTRLPSELADVIHSTSRQNDASSAQTMLNALGLVMASTQSDLLSQYAKERANTLPPTTTDIAIFEALNLAINELGPSTDVSIFEVWEPLANARNPVYRLLALRAAIHSTSRAAFGLSSEDPNFNRVDASAKLGFYLNFLDEIDPIILSESITAISTVPTTKARQTIETFLITQQKRGDTSLAQVAAQALRTQELITQGAP
ncbi:hypothetical protein SAMN02745166_02136 [Prosthecobacter debontii]|uniref:Uncharacterized protein n=1 Tax=Prosthecobacter debontii TaxID=48467 RepID=A0A1T4XXS0_9BACT|nr:hypothetical protein [Prosthecobacter debontii]SKA94314.1 hypothetical protein SAMN02745166_02136 [Prosthecobacter debontii]